LLPIFFGAGRIFPLCTQLRSVLGCGFQSGKIAAAQDQSFDPNARYSVEAASDGQIKVLVIGKPLSKEAPYISFRYLDDLLDRYDALPAPDRKRTEDRIIAAARAICCPTIRVGVVTLKRWALSSSMD
jgi:hypothetical protein